MPTPSSDPPLDPMSPAYSFSTCPEDGLAPSTTERANDTTMEPSREDSLDAQVTATTDRTRSPDFDSESQIARNREGFSPLEGSEYYDPTANESQSPPSRSWTPPSHERPTNQSSADLLRTARIQAGLDAEAAVRQGILSPDDTTIHDSTSAAPSPRSATLSPRLASSTTSLMTPPPYQDLEGPKSSNVASYRPERVAAGTFAADGLNPPYVPTSSLPSMDNDAEEEEFETTDMYPGFPNRRVIPTSPSSFLRPGSRFHGTQQSEKQVYDVQVEVKHVDLRESYLCGYLRIQGLTEDHPTLTTYFEGEIIGPKYGFITDHEDWGATDKIDRAHWGKFGAFRPYKSLAKKGNIFIPDPAQRETIFMRWKEHFLVPDHRVRTITGASFEGFYYICFNQQNGEISGIYFHSKSEKFQRLELTHVPNHGCFSAVEFR